MSGGSFHYLFRQEQIDPVDLDDMISYISKLTLNSNSKAYKDSVAIRMKMQEIKELQEKLSGVWHDIEWFVSNDYSWDQAVSSLIEYETRDES